MPLPGGIILEASGEGLPLTGSEGQLGATGVLGVADGDQGWCASGALDAVAVGSAVAACPPGGTRWRRVHLASPLAVC